MPDNRLLMQNFNNQTFNRLDLIRAWLRAREYRDASSVMRDYHAFVALAFGKAFGIDLDSPPENSPIPDEEGLYALFLRTVNCYENTRSPFAGVMAAGQTFVEIYREWGSPVNESIAELQDRYLMLMEKIVSKVWLVKRTRSVNRTQLEECGHPGWNPPDPIDDL